MNHTLTRLLLAAGGLLAVLPDSHAQQAQPAAAKGIFSPTPVPLASQKMAPAASPYRNATITTRLIPGANQTHGYEVLVNGHVLIKQPSIPGGAGNEGFRTPAEAQRVATLVASKLRDNQMPSVSGAELQRLRVSQN